MNTSTESSFVRRRLSADKYIGSLVNWQIHRVSCQLTNSRVLCTRSNFTIHSLTWELSPILNLSSFLCDTSKQKIIIKSVELVTSVFVNLCCWYYRNECNTRMILIGFDQCLLNDKTTLHKMWLNLCIS